MGEQPRRQAAPSRAPLANCLVLACATVLDPLCRAVAPALEVFA